MKLRFASVFKFIFCLQLVFTLLTHTIFLNWEGAGGEKPRFFLSFFWQEFSKLINREPSFISVSYIVTMSAIIIGQSEKLPLISKMTFD